jgi:hypothetical protein
MKKTSSILLLLALLLSTLIICVQPAVAESLTNPPLDSDKTGDLRRKTSGVEPESAGVIKIAFCPSWGIGFKDPSLIYNDLRINWSLYGDYELEFVNVSQPVTYEGLVATGAQVLVICDPAGGDIQYSNDEFAAIKSYLEIDAKGVFVTYLLRYSDIDNSMLAPLVGIESSYLFNTYPLHNNEYDIYLPDHPLFRDVSDPWVSWGYPHTQALIASNWHEALLPGAVVVAETTDTLSAVIKYSNPSWKGVWVTSMPDYFGNDMDKQFIYNSLVWLAHPEIIFDYHFQLNPFADVVHMDVDMPDMWIYGINEVPGLYSVPVLGKAERGRAYWACDLPAGGMEMYFVEINIATRDGYMYRIQDDMSLVGPDYVWLTPVAWEAEGASADDASGVEVSPQKTYSFHINPLIDIAYVHDDIKPWLYGYQDAPGYPGYPAPLLGYVKGSRFFWAADFVDGYGGYELYFCAGTVATRDADYTMTYDGYSYYGPSYIWLTPAASTASYTGAMAELD